MAAAHTANIILGFSATIAVVCAILWAFLAVFLARVMRAGPRWRAAVFAASLTLPLFVVLEVWGLALSLGRTWAPLPWIIASGGALCAVLIVPRMAVETRHLAPGPRRRGLTNTAVVIAVCTAIAELFVFVDHTRLTWFFGLVPLAVSIGSVLARLVRGRAPKPPVA